MSLLQKIELGYYQLINGGYFLPGEGEECWLLEVEGRT
jgi:hypothetical protein